jgi:hypothetical protein
MLHEATSGATRYGSGQRRLSTSLRGLAREGHPSVRARRYTTWMIRITNEHQNMNHNPFMDATHFPTVIDALKVRGSVWLRQQTSVGIFAIAEADIDALGTGVAGPHRQKGSDHSSPAIEGCCGCFTTHSPTANQYPQQMERRRYRASRVSGGDRRLPCGLVHHRRQSPTTHHRDLKSSDRPRLVWWLLNVCILNAFHPGRSINRPRHLTSGSS